jgi:hypothetical protein
VYIPGAWPGDPLEIVEESQVDLFSPQHLVSRGAQDLAYCRKLRVGIEMAAAKKHHLDVKADGTSIQKSIAVRLGYRGAERGAELLVADHLAQTRRKVLAVGDHLVLEPPRGVLFEDVHLSRTNNEHEAPMQFGGGFNEGTLVASGFRRDNGQPLCQGLTT